MEKGHREGGDGAKEPQKVPAELCLDPGSSELQYAFHSVDVARVSVRL